MTTNVLRRHRPGETPPVTHTELFFDLVYVFAFIQLSHHLHDHLTVRGAAETLVLFLGVWWAWNYTAWATNWVDPDKPPVRVLMIALMFLSLILSASIPQAFETRGLLFAAAYVGLQAVRGLFMVAAFGRQRMGRNYAQLTVWNLIAGVFWIAGAFVEADARLALWALAVAVDYAAPLHGFALPWLGCTRMQDWTLAGGHLAERGQLVVLIALGETILSVGLTLSGIPWTAAVASAFGVAFVMTVSLWWMYFIRSAEASAEAIAAAADPARLGRSGYAYGHAIMVAGVIMVAVASATTIGHPLGSVSGPVAAIILAGPAIYLLGNALFNFTLFGRPPWSRLVGALALAGLVPLAPLAAPLALSAATAVVMLVLALATGTPRRPRIPEPKARG